MKNPRDIIKRPVITERSTEMMADKNMCSKLKSALTKRKSSKRSNKFSK